MENYQVWDNWSACQKDADPMGWLGYRLVVPSIDRRVREALQKACPNAYKKGIVAWVLRRFIAYLLYSPCRDEITGDVVAPCQIMACIENIAYRSDYVACKFLDFVAAELPALCIGYTDWKHPARSLKEDAGESKARRVFFKMPAEVSATLTELCYVSTEERVDFHTGKPVSRRELQRAKELQRAQQQARLELAKAEQDTLMYGAPDPAMRAEQSAFLCFLLQDMIDHEAMRRRAYDYGRKQAIALLLSMPCETPKQQRERDRMLLLLHNPDAIPSYDTSEKTPRIYATGANLHQLKREVRKKMLSYPGAIHADLKASQFAIASACWGADKAKAFLQTCLDNGVSPWGLLLIEAGVSREMTDALKPYFKTALYSLTFLMSQKNMEQHLQASLVSEAGLTPAEAARLVKAFARLPVIADLTAARTRRMELAKQQGYLELLNGEKVYLATDGNRQANIRSLLARELQSNELFLMHPALAVMQSSCTCLSWLHDGFCVLPLDTSKRGRIVRQLKQSVDDNCKRLGIPTCLEIDENKSDLGEI